MFNISGSISCLIDVYPLVNSLVDPENHQFLVETNLPSPMNGRVYVNLPEGNMV
jgi:hypothetical protein